MRVALSNASARWGGVHAVTEALAAGLGARGHEVVVLCRPGSALEERLRGVVPLAPVLKGMDLGPPGIWRAARALRRFGAEVVLTLMEKDVRLTAPAAGLLGIPVVVRRANDRPLARRPYTRLLYGRIPVLHVANSEATRRTLLGSAPWLSPDSVRVVHNGIDAEAFARAEPADLGLPPGAPAVGYVGRFDRGKGVLEVARAWPAVAAALPEAHLVLAGKGPVEEEAREILRGAPRVRWIGYRTDVPRVMRALDVLAFPSRSEGFGLVAAEALAAGVPVVATRAGALPEVVRDGVDGVLVPPGDTEALARALVRLGSDPAERARMGRAGRERVRRDFSVERMVEEYESLLLRATGR